VSWGELDSARDRTESEAGLTLLQQVHLERQRRDENERRRALACLKEALHALTPGQAVWVFGSVTREGRFRSHSDVDIALEREPTTMSRYALQGEIEERIKWPVDLVILSECRFRAKIEREGWRWTA
jgi:predicted nucleotidyltransferase